MNTTHCEDIQIHRGGSCALVSPRPFRRTQARRCASLKRGLIAACVSLILTCAFPLSALADVRPTDAIAGKTASERGLDASLCPDISAGNALLISSDGTVLFERDTDEPVKIASLTKVMTAIVALENASLDTVVTVDYEAATVGESSAGLLEGDTMSLETALYALMVPSGNDASIAIAKAVGEVMTGSQATAYDAFIDAMNAKAFEIGCRDTVFTNPHGLDFGAFESQCHSTARDVGVMVSYAMRNETFRGIVDAGDCTITVTGAQGAARAVSLTSTDELIGVYEGICGVKTGTTDYAGYCFAGAVSREAGEFYSVVLDAPTSADRFSDTVCLMDWVYANLASKRLVNTDSSVDVGGNTAPLVAEVAHTGWVDALVPATVDNPDVAATVFTLRGSIGQEVTYEELSESVSQGDVIGSITFTQDGETVAVCNLIAAADQPAPNIFQQFGVWFDRLIRNMQGQPTVAESVCYNQPESPADR